MIKKTCFLLLVAALHWSQCNAEELKCSDMALRGICPMILDPVCGTDGRTYSNKCDLCARNAQLRIGEKWIQIARKGECGEAKGEGFMDSHSLKCSDMELGGMCPMILAPVCGTDGKTYSNKCELCVRNAKLKMREQWIQIARNGKC